MAKASKMKLKVPKIKAGSVRGKKAPNWAKFGKKK